MDKRCPDHRPVSVRLASDARHYPACRRRQVKALIRSLADGDEARFYAIATQVAAQAARSGHGKFAQELRELVDQVEAREGDRAPPRRQTRADDGSSGG